MIPRKHLLALAAALVLAGHATAAQEAAKAVSVREAALAITNEAGEIRYTVNLDFDYVNSLVDAAREAGYVDAGAATGDNPAMRFAADRLAARIGKKPESVQTQASMLFDVFASSQEILRLAAEEGVIDVAQREGQMELINPPLRNPSTVVIREAMNPVKNVAEEIRYTIYLDPFYTFKLKDEARAAGYVQADISTVGVDSQLELQKPEVRFVADKIAALIGKRPEKVVSWIGTEFDIYANQAGIMQLALAEGVTDIAQTEGNPAFDLIKETKEVFSSNERRLEIFPAEQRIINENGEVKYTVGLNPLYVDRFKPDALAAGYIQASTLDVAEGSPELQKPEVRFIADKIAAVIGKKVDKVRSWVATEFDIYAVPDEIQRIMGIEGVNDIEEVEGKISVTLSQSATIAPGDIWSGNEVIPWWKISTNTNDLQDFTSSQNIPIVIDGPMSDPISMELNMLQVGGDSSNSSADWGRWHSAHVNGVIGARRNNSLIMGINPGQPIVHLGTKYVAASVANKLDYAFQYYEDRNSWGAINMSMSKTEASAVNNFEFSGVIGRKMAVASNRSIILQSAGNNNSNACGWGHQYMHFVMEYDGVLMVGGHDINNQRSSNDWVRANNTGSWVMAPGSNAGHCVELWAPSRKITSLRYNTNLRQVLSGTSFAAPIATAIAMRYGNKNTRPLEREHFLRVNAQNQGNIAGNKALFVKYGNAPDKLLRHKIFSAWSPENNVNISRLYNEKYGDVWGSGGYYGVVVIDLGSKRTFAIFA